jgi:hypothetical protein
MSVLVYSRIMFAPGEGPFRAKGTVYTGLVVSTDQRCPGGFKAVLDNLPDDALRAFFTQRFLASSRYDIFPIIPFSRAAAKLAGLPPLQYSKEGARFAANRDIHGVYRFLLKLASPRLVAERLPRAYMQYFDFGQVEGRSLGEREFEIVGRGFPEPVAEWLVTAIEGFVPVAMQIAGARGILTRIDPLVREGEQHGVPLVRSRLHLMWS